MSEASKLTSFEIELENLINRHNIEKQWNMPDFLMAQLIVNFIKVSGPTLKANLDWHGTSSVCHPGPSVEVKETVI